MCERVKWCTCRICGRKMVDTTGGDYAPLCSTSCEQAFNDLSGLSSWDIPEEPAEGETEPPEGATGRKGS